MNSDEKYIARVLFKLKMYECDKQAYEDLFIRVMQNKNCNFQPVKPQGAYGDRKNDGFDKIKGAYYQVYAPEYLKGNETKTIKKLNEDFEGLYGYWTDNGFQIKEHYFVVNDHYKGAYASTHSAAQKIAEDYKIKSDTLINKHLEDIFFSLDKDKLLDIIGFIPDPLGIQEPDYDIMNEVIKHLLSTETPDSPEKIPDDPDVDKKIKFNSLSKPVSEYLNSGRRLSFVIKEYFELNSNFAREELRKRFNGLYIKGLSEIQDSECKNDEVFFFILKKASPKQNFAVYSAVYVLMAYYFEYCDIFETPNK